MGREGCEGVWGERWGRGIEERNVVILMIGWVDVGYLWLPHVGMRDGNEYSELRRDSGCLMLHGLLTLRGVSQEKIRIS